MAQHVERMSQDPLLRQESAMFRKMLQQADEILHNGTLKVQKMQAQEMEAQQSAMAQGQAVEATPQGISPDVIAKIEAQRAERQAKLEMDYQTHQQKMIMKQQEANQKLAIRDAEAASKIQRQGIRV
jgi:hypothetical protein